MSAHHLLVEMSYVTCELVVIILSMFAAGRSWKELTETEKAPYDALAEEERRKYEVAMREYSQVSL